MIRPPGRKGKVLVPSDISEASSEKSIDGDDSNSEKSPQPLRRSTRTKELSDKEEKGKSSKERKSSDDDGDENDEEEEDDAETVEDDEEEEVEMAGKEDDDEDDDEEDDDEDDDTEEDKDGKKVAFFFSNFYFIFLIIKPLGHIFYFNLQQLARKLGAFVGFMITRQKLKHSHLNQIGH